MARAGPYYNSGENQTTARKGRLPGKVSYTQKKSDH